MFIVEVQFNNYVLCMVKAKTGDENIQQRILSCFITISLLTI